MQNLLELGLYRDPCLTVRLLVSGSSLTIEISELNRREGLSLLSESLSEINATTREVSATGAKFLEAVRVLYDSLLGQHQEPVSTA